MGYHTGARFPNYWAYAHNFVLQDHVRAGRLLELARPPYLVSSWSAMCTHPRSHELLASFTSRSQSSDRRPSATRYAWTDLTYLLHKQHVSWGYYLAEGRAGLRGRRRRPARHVAQKPDAGDLEPAAVLRRRCRRTADRQHPDRTSFFKAARNGTLPAVSWVVPERRGRASTRQPRQHGQAYVTT